MYIKLIVLIMIAMSSAGITDGFAATKKANSDRQAFMKISKVPQRYFLGQTYGVRKCKFIKLYLARTFERLVEVDQVNVMDKSLLRILSEPENTQNEFSIEISSNGIEGFLADIKCDHSKKITALMAIKSLFEGEILSEDDYFDQLDVMHGKQPSFPF